MVIKMLKDVEASANESGNASKLYKTDEIIECKKEWQINLANVFLSSDLAIEVKVDKPKETKAKKKVVKKKAVKKSK
jgi:hypothetical protein|tara:strand:+ start:914 stop:1144 length:231 start_codon:yes stop_codon:yes gene_type:complete